MKALIKAIVPSKLWERASRERDRLSFAVAAREPFHSANLRPASNVDLSQLWGRKDITEAWANDHADISQVFGGEHIFAGANPGDRRAIYYLIMALRSRSVLEVGTFVGASLIHIASALKRTRGHVDAVDIVDVNAQDGPWTRVGLPGPPAQLIARIGGGPRVDFHITPAIDFMRSHTGKYDLIFLDGDYSARAQYQEISAALSILNEDGVVLLHNYYPDAKPLFPDGVVIPGPYEAMNRIRQEESGFNVYPIGALPWPTKQGANVTTLALLLKE